MSIAKLLQLEEDAFKNFYEARFNRLPAFLDIDSLNTLEQTQIRIQNITIPTSSIPTTKVYHAGFSLDVPIGLEEFPQELTFELRVNKNWKYRAALGKWKNKINDFTKETLGNDTLDNVSGYFILDRFDKTGTKISNASIIFYNVYPKNIGELAFDYTSGDPMTVTITLGFSYYIDELEK